MQFRSYVTALALGAGLSVSSFSFAQVTGKVTLDGKAPEMKTIDMSGVKECADQHADPVTEETVVADDKGGLKNVVVSLKKEEGQEVPSDAPKSAAVLDQKGCQYVPHVVACMVGQEFDIRNDDPFLHNVHSLAQVNPVFNFAQPNKDPGKKTDSPKAEETYKVKCDVHPWMLAWVRVLDNPFFATTGDDGSYKIEGPKLADGEYTFVAWHEKYGDSEPQKVTVKDGKAEANFTFKESGAQANPIDTGVKLASDTTKTMHCPACEKKAADTKTAKAE
jgi:hypothetical protein